MAVREIVLYPDPILKQVCAEANWTSPEVAQLCEDLVDTLRESPGVGVAAPQIGTALRAIVVDVSPKHPGHGLMVLLNPVLITAEGRVTGREGCLSIPEYTANVTRHERIGLSATDPQGKNVVFESSGFEAICLQHELDHLDGILFLDRITCLKTDLFRRKPRKT